jgi:integrase
MTSPGAVCSRSACNGRESSPPESAIVHRVGRAAGVPGVHPHRLRHTLATQAINRGMRLEAIVAAARAQDGDDPDLRPDLRRRARGGPAMRLVSSYWLIVDFLLLADSG